MLEALVGLLLARLATSRVNDTEGAVQELIEAVGLAVALSQSVLLNGALRLAASATRALSLLLSADVNPVGRRMRAHRVEAGLEDPDKALLYAHKPEVQQEIKEDAVANGALPLAPSTLPYAGSASSPVRTASGKSSDNVWRPDTPVKFGQPSEVDTNNSQAPTSTILARNENRKSLGEEVMDEAKSPAVTYGDAVAMGGPKADPSPIVSSNGTDFDETGGDHVQQSGGIRQDSGERTPIKVRP